MKKIIILVSILISIFLSGCVKTVPFKSSKIEKNKVLVYVYRPESLIYRGTPYYVYVNGEKKGTIINNGYLTLYLNKGNNTISLKNYSLIKNVVDSKNFVFEKEKMYFVRVNSGLYGYFTLELVNPNIGLKEIKKTKYYEGSLITNKY
jgi:hypothetical protein